MFHQSAWFDNRRSVLLLLLLLLLLMLLLLLLLRLLRLRLLRLLRLRQLLFSMNLLLRRHMPIDTWCGRRSRVRSDQRRLQFHKK